MNKSIMKIVNPSQPAKEIDTSKYDIPYRGKTIRLKLDPCGCGVHALWTVEAKLSSVVPDSLKEMVPGDKTITQVIDDWHFHPTWFQKHILRHKIDKELKKWIEKTRKEYLKVQASDQNLGDLWSKL